MKVKRKKNIMITYTVGTACFCDYHFGGKPAGKVVEIVEPGDGRGLVKGLVRVQLTETVGAYRKGEVVELPAWQAVPKKQEFRKPGSCFRFVSTSYQYTK